MTHDRLYILIHMFPPSSLDESWHLTHRPYFLGIRMTALLSLPILMPHYVRWAFSIICPSNPISIFISFIFAISDIIPRSADVFPVLILACQWVFSLYKP